MPSRNRVRSKRQNSHHKTQGGKGKIKLLVSRRHLRPSFTGIKEWRTCGKVAVKSYEKRRKNHLLNNLKNITASNGGALAIVTRRRQYRGKSSRVGQVLSKRVQNIATDE